jgi:hypothetical protein
VLRNAIVHNVAVLGDRLLPGGLAPNVVAKEQG